MVQAFQRQMLTYIPDYQPPWNVQFGNVGMQYYQWRYGKSPVAPNRAAAARAATAAPIVPMQPRSSKTRAGPTTPADSDAGSRDRRRHRSLAGAHALAQGFSRRGASGASARKTTRPRTSRRCAPPCAGSSAGKRLLDLGSGMGGLAVALAREGAAHRRPGLQPGLLPHRPAARPALWAGAAAAGGRGRAAALPRRRL